MFIRFDVIHERDGRTDGQTDRQTLHDSKDRACASHRAVKTIHHRFAFYSDTYNWCRQKELVSQTRKTEANTRCLTVLKHKVYHYHFPLPFLSDPL